MLLFYNFGDDLGVSSFKHSKLFSSSRTYVKNAPFRVRATVVYTNHNAFAIILASHFELSSKRKRLMSTGKLRLVENFSTCSFPSIESWAIVTSHTRYLCTNFSGDF